MSAGLRWAVAIVLVGMLAGSQAQAKTRSKDDAERGPTKELLAAAQADNAEAEYLLGISELARRDHPDPVRAAQWLDKAAAAGHGRAKVVLAGLYLRGVGVKPDARRAASLLREPAAAGNAEAQLQLGQLLTDGRGIRRDTVQGAKWLAVAGALGDGRVKQEAESRLSALERDRGQRAVARGRRLGRAWITTHGIVRRSYDTTQPGTVETAGLSSVLGEKGRLDRR